MVKRSAVFRKVTAKICKDTGTQHWFCNYCKNGKWGYLTNCNKAIQNHMDKYHGDKDVAVKLAKKRAKSEVSTTPFKITKSFISILTHILIMISCSSMVMSGTYFYDFANQLIAKTDITMFANGVLRANDEPVPTLNYDFVSRWLFKLRSYWKVDVQELLTTGASHCTLWGKNGPKRLKTKNRENGQFWIF